MNTMARLKRPVNLALDTDLMDRLDGWISKQEFPPSKTAVFETALRAWLDEREGGKKEKRRT